MNSVTPCATGKWHVPEPLPPQNYPATPVSGTLLFPPGVPGFRLEAGVCRILWAPVVYRFHRGAVACRKAKCESPRTCKRDGAASACLELGHGWVFILPGIRCVKFRAREFKIYPRL